MENSRKPAAAKPKPIYRVLFQNQGNLYELYARKVGQGDLFAFVEVEDIIFGSRGGVLVDPSEERLKSEFAGVKRTYIPMPAMVRIDEVEKEGANKIIALAAPQGNVTPFPLPPGPPESKPGRR
jgi:hypothetical protein